MTLLRNFILLISFVASLVFPQTSSAEVFTKEGYYSIDLSGWQRNSIPDGDAYTCAACDSLVQVAISFGPDLPAESPFHNNDEFLSAFNTEKLQRDFSEQMLRQSIPIQDGYNIIMQRVGLMKIDQVNALSYAAIIEMPPTVSHETTSFLIHRNRIMRISVNYFDGTRLESINGPLSALFESIKLQ